jgi:tetratricopeptide (TPR) repeat protein
MKVISHLLQAIQNIRNHGVASSTSARSIGQDDYDLGNRATSTLNWGAGIPFFLAAVQKEPNNPEFIRALATCKHFVGEYKESIELYDRAIAIQPYDPCLYSNRSISKEHSEDYFGAIEDATSAITLATVLEEREREYYCQRGRSYYSLGVLDRSLQDFSEALALDPTSSELSEHVADLRAQLEEYELQNQDAG